MPKIARQIIQKAVQQKQYQLLEPQAKELIEAFGIPTTRHSLVYSVKEAVLAANLIGYPVVMKIVSPDVLHKTDYGGVRLNVKNGDEVEYGYEGILKNVKKKVPDARIIGILVEEMATPSTEVIIGGLRDPQFGPAVMFGIGGIFVEVYKDASFRIAPVDEFEAIDMINEIKGAKILKGFRGAEAVDIAALAQAIVHISDIMVSINEIKEIDLNPVLVYLKGIKAVDVRIILSERIEGV